MIGDRYCEQCGTPWRSGARFCATCGIAAPWRAAQIRPRLSIEIEDRSVLLWVLLSLFTCGVGTLVWLALVAWDLGRLLPDRAPRPGLDIVLLIVTLGLYGWFLAWKYPHLMLEAHRRAGRDVSDLRAVCLLLYWFTGLIVPLAVVQSQLNDIAASTDR